MCVSERHRAGSKGCGFKWTALLLSLTAVQRLNSDMAKKVLDESQISSPALVWEWALRAGQTRRCVFMCRQNTGKLYKIINVLLMLKESASPRLK